MLIPVRCWSCNKVLAHDWAKYNARVNELYAAESPGEYAQGEHISPPIITGDQLKTDDKYDLSPHAVVLHEMGIHRMCCRTIMLTHRDMYAFVR